LVANVAIIILQAVFLICVSTVSQISFSDFARPGVCAPRLSPVYNLTPSVPILAIFAKSVGLSIDGV